MEKITFDWQISGLSIPAPPASQQSELNKKSLKRQHEFPFNSFQFQTDFQDQETSNQNYQKL